MKQFFYLMLILSFVIMCQASKNFEHSSRRLWKKDGYFKQTNIILKNLDKGIIRARVDNRWQNFTIKELPESFVEWNLKRRLEMLDDIKQGTMPSLAGSHNGMVASHNGRRRDAQFTINCAVKGMGFLPKPEKLSEVLNLLKSTSDADDSTKFRILENLYKHGKEIFDLTKQISLELYATPEFETHTFINQMTDPSVAIVFLDFPSYELRALSQLLHPLDPTLTPYQRDVVDYINTMHDYFHSRSPRPSIGVIYHIIEVFDNTPGRARGKRIVPPLP